MTPEMKKMSLIKPLFLFLFCFLGAAGVGSVCIGIVLIFCVFERVVVWSKASRWLIAAIKHPILLYTIMYHPSYNVYALLPV